MVEETTSYNKDRNIKRTDTRTNVRSKKQMDYQIHSGEIHTKKNTKIVTIDEIT